MSEKQAPETKKNTSAWKARAAKFFERFDLREEQKVTTAGKWLIFALLVFISAMIMIQLLTERVELWRVIVAASVLVGLIIGESITLFVAKKFKPKVICYIADFLCIFTLVSTTGSSYMPILYILILTEFYLSSQKVRVSVLVFTISVPVYVAAYAVAISIWRLEPFFSLLAILTQSFEALVYLVVHFFVVNFLLGFYRQYLRLTKAMADLDESKAELQKAYDELAEVTALEERQRIAKDIHDTAGHSITTVIMQTEAAKLILDKDPSQAKQKIVAANLQAKHALEELRDSVHLLSGSLGKPALKTALLSIVTESTDGTDIRIRHDIDDIDDVTVGDGKYRFLCNSLKEGISNGLRHGGATAFYFELKEQDGKLQFLLSDNGKGVQTGKLNKGFGLTGMAARAEALGGKATFYTGPDDGFEIRISLPVDEK